QADLRVDDRVLVRVAEFLLAAGDEREEVAPNEYAARQEVLVFEEPAEDLGRLHEAVVERVQPSRRDAVLVVALALALARPAVPELERPEHHGGCGMGLQQRDLLGELLRRPDVVAVEVRDVPAARVADAEVA